MSFSYQICVVALIDVGNLNIHANHLRENESLNQG
jgi:hypothetical protein